MAPMTTKNGKTAFKSLVSTLSKKKDGRSLVKFAHYYLDHTPETEIVDLIDSRPELSQHIEDVFTLMKNWRPGDVHVRVYRAAGTNNTILEAYMNDGPFLVDSLWEEVQSSNLEVRHTFHPVLLVKRDVDGKLIDFKENTTAEEGKSEGYHREVFIHMELDYMNADEDLKGLEEKARDLLTQAVTVKRDFTKMIGKMETLIAEIETSAKAGHHGEDAEFFKWLIDKNYIFLGYRHYSISRKGAKTYMKLTKKSGMGILSDDKTSSVYNEKCLDDVPPNLKHYYSNKKEFVTITKALTKSPVHRRADMDYIGVKEFDAKGNVIGEHRFLGLLTSRAYTTNPREIPLVRKKIEAVLNSQHNLHPQSHNHKALVNILETYPRDELFQIHVDDLERISTGILNLKERQQVRVFTRHSRHELLTTAMVYIPNERMNSALRETIIELLRQAYNAEDVEFIVSLGESRLARLFLKIRSKPPTTPMVNDVVVENMVRKAAKSWSDDLAHELCVAYGELEGLRLHATYGAAFRAGYQENNSVCLALQDIASFENMNKHGLKFLVAISEGQEGDEDVHLKVFHKEGRLNLSELMPTFNNMGLHVTDENSTPIQQADGENIWVHDFGVQVREGQEAIREDKTISVLTEALECAWYGELENDELNSLIVGAGLSVREVVYLRTFVAYLQQTVMPYSKGYIRQTLINNAQISKMLCDLFDASFNPEKVSSRTKSLKAINNKIEEALSMVKSLDEDVILRQVWGVIKACLRTNAFQSQSPTAPLAIKMKSSEIPNLPKPHPLFEIFVYHSTVEGVHLRGGMVARGGLRWSDRPEDFRTEVLGLMKTQMTKNAVIVPLGSKGGFVLKVKPTTNTREAMMEAVQTVYKIFIGGLLSVTDNLSAGNVLKPRNVVCLDGDDPYLVVAADKGTATFSDMANGEAMAADYWDGTKDGFWLGDAFASGGSNGYDHKKMGITARGAWECVKHHFREQNKDIQTEEFTCVGIGDMAGDVFGNGMLLSKKTKLVAAFNHMHIFIDPTPDTEKSYKERERLFKNPSLSWADYDQKLVSKGGALFSRSDKSITISSEAQEALGLKKNKMTPNELIKGILRAPVDLLWNGGIGTFIKAGKENNIDVGDRANDAIRINAGELRAKVLGEGGNLGSTQLARIEFALNNGYVNTDAIDNSAGVNCSDIEVNIKILLSLIQENTKMTNAARNKLLGQMTEEVGELALEANYRQSQILSIAQTVSKDMLEPHKRLISSLHKKGFLDPKLEFLPDDEELENRVKEGKGLTRPELSVLMAYAKMDIYNTLLSSKLPSEEVLEDLYLYNYFPTKLQAKYKDMMDNHRLKREIVATQVTNELINRMGMTFMDRMMDETGHEACTITRAFIIAKTLLGAQEWYDTIDALDNKVSAQVQRDLRDIVKKLVEGTAFWFLRNGSEKPLNITNTLAKYQKPFEEVGKNLEKHLTDDMKSRLERRKSEWLAKGVPEKIAKSWSFIPSLNCSADVATIAIETNQTISDVMDLHFRVGECLNMDVLHKRTKSIPVTDNWQRVGSLSIIEQLYGFQKQITGQVIAEKQATKLKKADDAVNSWLSHKNGSVSQYQKFIKELVADETTTHAMLNVALGQLKGLIN
tara:strand:- start:52601 stop:57454 length:4854 start_codon:yes stop_codon:yes gene_type:complete